MRYGPFAALAIVVPLGSLALAQTGAGAPQGSVSDGGAEAGPPPRPMAGYSYGEPRASKGQETPQRAAPRIVKAAAAKPSGPIATLPGFEMLGDGSSRVFVQLTQPVPVEERKAKGSLTYVLKGAHVTVHNNTNPLVTVHFNTPVREARLRPAGADLLLVIDLRAQTTPSWKITPAKDGAAILQIDFPKGSFVPSTPEPAKDKDSG